MAIQIKNFVYLVPSQFMIVDNSQQNEKRHKWSNLTGVVFMCSLRKLANEVVKEGSTGKRNVCLYFPVAINPQLGQSVNFPCT